MAIPRIGQEVIIEFLEGDPDQPIITGRTYHDVNRTCYFCATPAGRYSASLRSTHRLPEHKTRMTIKSKTHKGDGFNELRFEDEKGREEIFVHAERNLHTTVKNNEYTSVMNNFYNYVFSSALYTIGDNQSNIIGKNYYLHTGGDVVITTGSGQRITELNALKKVVQGKNIDKSLIIESYIDQTYNLSPKNKGLGNIHITSQNDTVINASEDLELSANQSTSISGQNMSVSGNDGTNISAGKTLQFSAADILKSADAMIDIFAGDMIRIKSKGSVVKIKSNGLIEISSDKIELNGDTININGKNEVNIKGGKINLN